MGAQAPQISQNPINFTIKVTGAVANLADGSCVVPVPSFIVPARATVSVQPSAANAHAVGVARHREDIETPDETEVLITQRLTYPVRNLNEIWVHTHLNESADVIVSAPAIDVA